MSADSQLLNSLREQPRNLLVRQAYVDWLEERGDVRGEYLRLELQLSQADESSAAALRAQMLRLRGEIDMRWLAALEQPNVMLTNPSPFPLTWFASPIKGCREDEEDSTYVAFDYDRQPPLPVELFHGDFDWLRHYPIPWLAPIPMEELPARRASLEAALEKQEAMLGFPLPAEYRRWMIDAELHRRVRSGTGCYFEPRKVANCPRGGEGKLVHFYSDSQGCLFWCLYLHPHGGHYVVVSSDWNIFTPDDAQENSPNVYYCAPSLEAFVYRMWIEEELGRYLARRRHVNSDGELELPEHLRLLLGWLHTAPQSLTPAQARYYEQLCLAYGQSSVL